jgi:tRNA(fMet)-specific endonuclease VapC
MLLALVRGMELGRFIAQQYRLSEVVRRPLVSVVSHGELMAMAKRNAWGDKKLSSLRMILDSMVTIDLNDPAILDAYVLVDQANQKVPNGARILSNNDMWIAATTRASDGILLTSDRDFLHLHPNVCKVEFIDQQSKLPQSFTGTQQTIQ